MQRNIYHVVHLFTIRAGNVCTSPLIRYPWLANHFSGKTMLAVMLAGGSIYPSTAGHTGFNTFANEPQGTFAIVNETKDAFTADLDGNAHRDFAVPKQNRHWVFARVATGTSTFAGSADVAANPFPHRDVSNSFDEGDQPGLVSQNAASGNITFQKSLFFADADGDGFGDPKVSTLANQAPAGYVEDNTDCDDTNSTINPDTEWVLDADNDGFFYGEPVWSCAQPGPGFKVRNRQYYAGDCNDSNGSVNPVAGDTPNDGIDQDCDGLDLKTWYRDADNDGYGTTNEQVNSNYQPDGFVADNTDCDDWDAAAHPGAVVCPVTMIQPYHATGKYTLEALNTEYECGITEVLYAVSGATVRSGSGRDASGTFNPGTSTITWTIRREDGNNTICESSVIISSPGAVIRINAGGGAVNASGDRSFAADRYYGGTDRVRSIANLDILNTTDDALYQNERSAASFHYSIPVPNGKTSVVLHFAEIWFGVPGKAVGQAGKRRFNVNIEGIRKLTNYDIFAKAGGPLRAIQETFQVVVKDGVLNIDFLSGAANFPTISAIEVITQDAGNQPPVLATIGNKTAFIGQELTFTAVATDPDASQTRHFSLMNAPAGASIEPTTGVFKWTPAAAGTSKFTVQVTDSGTPSLSDFEEITITVPSASAGNAIRINAGGTAFTTADNRTFLADQYYTGIDRVHSITTGTIANTSEDALYGDERSSAAFGYAIPVQNGKMDVVLHFAEIWFGAPGKSAGGAGKRRFHVNIEGTRKLTNYDIYAKAGGALRAVRETFTTTVTDGVLNLDFLSGLANLPTISAIEVIPQSKAARIAADDETSESSLSKSQVFPNPAGSRFTVLLSSLHSGKVNLQLTSLAGFTFYPPAPHQPVELQLEADLSSLHLSSGTYILQIKSAAFTEHIKVVISE
ncbi:malectin domain-containing carbohydrate-binding protein [Dyadobacter sandarakinus]|uniref:T9SS type A sorting domain-containing protein n=1 Tax=Dyadobacter sandarakinus TaxID=2747268 RepID=A0ABX7I4K1_9BACT|nr:malectin domain-containing carbohydrate-binding protein [Dyadobacter sandarakinus]QRR00788.1 T9SS type A sorting domain-containing protein [Dyadobacter sandarakinus]